ncbi:MAG: SDR family oxidoreductase [Rhodospirillales bacterium]|nr:SDR family oxidoreductase [Rhodospirillales bacterium]
MASTVFITGAGKGLGLEFARQYAQAGWRVIATCRAPAKSAELKALGVETHPLDVADFDAVSALAKKLRGTPIDLLLGNAAQFGEAQDFGQVDMEDWATVLRVDVMAPLALAQSFVDHVAQSPGRVMAFLSSRMGSIADNGSGGFYIYRTAKAALNMLVKNLAVDLEPRGIVAVALHPGWVRTDMGGPNAPLEPPVSVAGLRTVLSRITDRDTGKFYGHDGVEIPW